MWTRKSTNNEHLNQMLATRSKRVQPKLTDKSCRRSTLWLIKRHGQHPVTPLKGDKTWYRSNPLLKNITCRVQSRRCRGLHSQDLRAALTRGIKVRSVNFTRLPNQPGARRTIWITSQVSQHSSVIMLCHDKVRVDSNWPNSRSWTHEPCCNLRRMYWKWTPLCTSKARVRCQRNAHNLPYRLTGRRRT